MITGTVTLLIIFAVIGSILYGHRLIKTEKSDAVFGNPERAKGGIHWVIVGTGFLLFTWLYYSWDIAKAFYPKSANELCQVAKVNESLLSLKYLFPIEERSHKSTALIKREHINISNKILEIQNSLGLKNQDKTKFVNLLNKTRKTIHIPNKVTRRLITHFYFLINNRLIIIKGCGSNKRFFAQIHLCACSHNRLFIK